VRGKAGFSIENRIGDIRRSEEELVIMNVSYIAELS
jgi:hypothetical protein